MNRFNDGGILYISHASCVPSGALSKCSSAFIAMSNSRIGFNLVLFEKSLIIGRRGC